jgi:hypothetical protein
MHIIGKDPFVVTTAVSKKGKFEGTVTYKWPDGEIEEHTFKNGKEID